MSQGRGTAAPAPLPGIRRIVVLGHTGFIGQRIVASLRDAGGPEVVGVSREGIDLAGPEAISHLGPLFGPDACVVHAAAVKRQLGDDLDALRKNLGILASVAECIEDRGIGRLVFVSSTAVYGETTAHDVITESTPVNPETYYGVGKFAGECMLARAAQKAGGAFLAVRPALTYGPGDYRGSYGPSGFLQAAVDGQVILLWGDGSERREFVYVDDVAQAISQFAIHDAEGVVNIVTGHSRTFAEAMEVVQRLSSGPADVRTRPRTKAKVDHVFDNRRLQALLPGLSFTGLEEGMRRTFAAEKAARSPHFPGVVQ